MAKLPKCSRLLGNWIEEHDSDIRFRPEVEIRLFHACAVKNTQYNPYLWPNRRNVHVF